MISETQNGREIRSSYDPLGRRIQRATASGYESLWQFDANGLPTTLELPDAQAFAFLHDALGRETERQLPGGARTEQAFDPVGRLTNQRTQLRERSGRLLQQRRIQYRADGLPAQIDDSRRGALSFQFSPTGQVLHAQGRDAQSQQRHEQYAYDLAGNLLEAINYNARGEPEASTLGARSYQGSRLTLAGKVRYLYDAEGRIVKRIEGKRWGTTAQREWLYEWTSDSRLKRLTTPEGQVWRYGYDAFGRRLSKREEKPEGQAWIEIQYLWDGNVLAEEVRLRHTPNSDGTSQTETLKSVTWDYEPGTWRPLSQTETLHHANGEIQRKTYAILSDHLGTPKELLDQEGEIAWAADSDLWGDTTVLAEAKTDCPLRFQGQYFDEESRLAYNCQRYYDPATGRYLSNDPLGLAGGPSPHAYVHNPLTWVDPLGLCPATGNNNWDVPQAAKDKIPNEWGEGVPNRKGVGMRWDDPANKGNGVRIDQGNLNNSQPVQQVDHVVVRSGGRVIGANGKPLPGSIKQNPEQAHIPLTDWLKWKKWDSPN